MTRPLECATCGTTITLDNLASVKGPVCDSCIPGWHLTARHFANATQSWLDARRTLRVLHAIGTDRSIPGADLAANLEATGPRR